METEPIKSDDIRNPDGTFKVGNPGSPGRPKGKTMKEWAREFLANLDEEEKKQWLKDLPKDVIWKMAEGNPSNESDLKVTVDKPLIKLNE